MIGRLLFTLSFLFLAGFTIAQTSIEGRVIDDSEQPVIYGTVILYQNGVQEEGTETDLDGYYSFSNIDPGTYDIEFSYVGFQTQMIEGVRATAGKATKVNATLTSGVNLDEIVIKDYKVPLIEQDNTTQGDVVTSEEIQNLPIKNVNALAATTAGASSIDGGAISIRGSRSNNTVYIIDGIRTTGRVVPQTEIDQLQIMTGGIPANIGDVTGGVISLTTKGPSQKISGGIELETSEFLDPYGYNLAMGNLSGPIIKNKEGQSIIGFRFSGQYIEREDDNPSYLPRYYASEEALDRIAEQPLFREAKRLFPTAETLRDRADGGEVIQSQSRPNDGNRTIDVTGKIDFRLAKGLDLSLSGAYFDGRNRFTGNSAGGSFSLVNYDRNPYNYSENIRLNARIRHKLGGSQYQSDEESKPQGLIRNVSYTIQGGYEKRNSRTEDIEHEDDLFRYGYVGKFNRDYEGVASIVEGATSLGDRDSLPQPDASVFVPFPQTDSLGTWYIYGDVSERENDNFFEPNFDINPILARMNQFEPGVATNGFVDNSVNSVWSIYSNRGMVYNNFQKSENELYTMQGSLNFDLFPGGSERGRHNIELGFLYEQRIQRVYSIAPQRLWEVANQLSNTALSGIDYSKPIADSFLVVTGPGGINQYEIPAYEPFVDADIGDGFYKNIREQLGVAENQYINIDELDPSQLSLDLFSPRELTDQSIMGYYGYDYLGEPLDASVNFTDFFNPANGENRQVAPFTPIYYAGYIQDKFSYKDLILRLGVRADFYDANTKVMRDPLSLYPVVNARDYYAQNPSIDRPSGVEDDYLVYLESPDRTEPFAFREGETWYNSQGVAQNSGAEIWGTRSVTAARYDDLNRITDPDFDVDASFKDYETQVNIMPRLAFSFPISDEANFFAHYDILTQRPNAGNSYVSPLQYFYYDQAGRIPLANSSLRPEKTVDYEVGFQQKLTNSSALKIAAYYKELRDMQQRRTLLYLPGVNSRREIYDNIDFGTVYGFTFTYDLRRTGNIRFKAGYTLQFAKGTGSNADSQAGLTQRGNLRNLFFFNYDERHRFTINMDYRYGSGGEYNGPTLFGADIFANTGLNVQSNIVSGRPYTPAQAPTLLGGAGFDGSINSARLPWVLSLDARLDKNIKLTSGAEGKKPLYLNIYLRAQNLLNVENVIGVYRYSQSPEDPGYLTFEQGESLLNQYQTGVRPLTDANVNAFLDAYNWATQNPGFYTLPRRMYLGVIFQF